MRLADWLHAKRMTQQQFAEAIGSSQSQVARFAADKRIPNKPVMQKIAEATAGAVQPNDFFGFSGSTPTEPAAA